MNATTASEIARLKTLTITQIVQQFESLFGEKCRSRNKRYLIRRIAWRLQASRTQSLITCPCDDGEYHVAAG